MCCYRRRNVRSTDEFPRLITERVSISSELNRVRKKRAEARGFLPGPVLLFVADPNAGGVSTQVKMERTKEKGVVSPHQTKHPEKLLQLWLAVCIVRLHSLRVMPFN